MMFKRVYSYCLSSFGRFFLGVSGFVLFSAMSTSALTLNGNDFALYYSEAKTEAERTELFSEAEGNPHFFRYLQIMEMNEVTQDGRSAVAIVAFEPASLMDVHFFVTRSKSRSLLKTDPVSKPGTALAVTGKVLSVDRQNNMMRIGSVILRHKDRLSPAVGKELLCEVDPRATFYSYTAGPRPVSLTYKDRDLLKYKKGILGNGSPKDWVEFLEKRLAQRNKERAAAAARKKEAQ